LENDRLMDPVHLSSKEVPGLAARVLGTALMPWGASASASEAIEFGELVGWQRLDALAAQLDDFSTSMWRAPEIVAEHDDHALCDAHDGSALFFGAALADWLGAWSAQRGPVAVALRNVVHVADLHVIPYWLARQGYAGFVATGRADGEGRGEGSGVVFSAASAGRVGWKYWAMQDSMARTDAAQTLMRELERSMPSRAALKAFLLNGRASCDEDRGFTWLDQNHAVVVAQPVQTLAGLVDDAGMYTLDATRLSALKAQAMAEGWPIPRDQWEQLMRFADRSLIRSSDRSREGAG
jgi:hypothetical protein